MVDYNCPDCDEKIGTLRKCQNCDRFKSSEKKKCPQPCPLFECILDPNTCHNECKILEDAGKDICALCKHNDTCTDERRAVLLHKDLPKSERHEIDEFEEIHNEHYYLERRYREIKDKFYKVKGWNIYEKIKLAKEGSRIKTELKLIRKFMDMAHIKYEVNVKLK